MIFDAKDIISDAVARVVRLLSPRLRGDVVSWGEIETAAGFERESTHWTSFNRRMRRIFRQNTGIVLWPVVSVGLKLLTTDEQLNMRSISRQRRAIRQLTRDVVELKALPDAELSDHQRNAKRRKIDQTKNARRAVIYSDRLAHQLMRPIDTGMPRRISPSRGTV